MKGIPVELFRVRPNTWEMSTPPKTNKPVEAWVASTLFEMGLGTAVVARHRSGGRVEFGFFLLDVFCLGIKNAGYAMCDSQAEFEEALADLERNSPLDSHSPACVRKLIENAAAYAKRYGFNPHPDYRVAARVLGGINPADCSVTWKFGRDGKPFFVAGPHETPRKIDSILRTLKLTAGEGNFDFILPMSAEDLEL